MKKVTVTRIVKLDNTGYFKVQVNDETVSIYAFKIGAADNDIYHEETNRLAAMELAAKLENGDKETKEIIYQTPI